MRIHLVRHGRSAPRPVINPADWVLHRDAAAGVAELRGSGVLPVAGHWCSSPEPKALAAARLLASTPVTIIQDLREQVRPARWYEDAAAFTAAVERAMLVADKPGDVGWETSAATTVRVVAAVTEITRTTAADDVVLVGHGTTWTLLVAALTATPPDVAAWCGMTMPDHCVIENGHLSRHWGSWRSDSSDR